MRKLLTGFLAVSLAVVAAAPASAGNKDDLGLILGALGGGVVGHQFGKGKGNTWATAIGAVAGAVAGQSIGTSLDRADRAYYRSGRSNGYYNSYSYHRPRHNFYKQQHVVYSAPSYEQRVRTYEVIPAAAVVDNSMSGQHCREYQQKVTVGGRTQGSYGTACLMPDGDWQVIN
ncbi:MAG: glycine zipper 2TM domain-containing protein [Bdellovibrionales bacterium]